jgi:hypothetical protein
VAFSLPLILVYFFHDGQFVFGGFLVFSFEIVLLALYMLAIPLKGESHGIRMGWRQ